MLEFKLSICFVIFINKRVDLVFLDPHARHIIFELTLCYLSRDIFTIITPFDIELLSLSSSSMSPSYSESLSIIVLCSTLNRFDLLCISGIESFSQRFIL